MLCSNYSIEHHVQNLDDRCSPFFSSSPFHNQQLKKMPRKLKEDFKFTFMSNQKYIKKAYWQGHQTRKIGYLIHKCVNSFIFWYSISPPASNLKWTEMSQELFFINAGIYILLCKLRSHSHLDMFSTLLRPLCWWIVPRGICQVNHQTYLIK